jgi:hypothetical protein
MALAPAMAAVAQDANTMKIRFTMDGKELATATLKDNATARDLVALLPITLALEDYASTEKISYLPRKLSTADARPAAILNSATSPTTRRGAIWRSSTRTSAIRKGSSCWVGSTPA